MTTPIAEEFIFATDEAPVNARWVQVKDKAIQDLEAVKDGIRDGQVPVDRLSFNYEEIKSDPLPVDQFSFNFEEIKSDPLPADQFSLNYEEIKVTYDRAEDNLNDDLRDTLDVYMEHGGGREMAKLEARDAPAEAPINYGDFTGTTVMYIDVTE